MKNVLRTENRQLATVNYLLLPEFNKRFYLVPVVGFHVNKAILGRYFGNVNTYFIHIIAQYILVKVAVKNTAKAVNYLQAYIAGFINYGFKVKHIFNGVGAKSKINAPAYAGVVAINSVLGLGKANVGIGNAIAAANRLKQRRAKSAGLHVGSILALGIGTQRNK